MAARDQDTDTSSVSSVDLSCGSSDYEIEYPENGLLPYQFEPVSNPEEKQDLEEDSNCMGEDQLISTHSH